MTLRLAKRSGPLPLSLGVVGLVAACYCSPFRAAWTASPGIALLIAGLTTAADLFSVFVGPAKAIVERAAPALDYLLLIFPTFGYPLGFALSVTETPYAWPLLRRSPPPERPVTLPTLTLGCAAALLAMLVGLLGEAALPPYHVSPSRFLLYREVTDFKF